MLSKWHKRTHTTLEEELKLAEQAWNQFPDNEKLDGIAWAYKRGADPITNRILCPKCRKFRKVVAMKHRSTENSKYEETARLSCGHKYHFKKRDIVQDSEFDMREERVRSAVKHYFKDKYGVLVTYEGE